jgi:hypothetical protein
MLTPVTRDGRDSGYHRRMSTRGWFYEVGGERRGPVTLEALQGLAKAGTVVRETRVWADGVNEPVAAGRLVVLFPPLDDPAVPDPALRWLLPVGRSGFAIAAGYLGLLSPIPFVGYFAILFAVLAIVDLKKRPQLAGWGRVIFALVLGIPFSLLYTFFFFTHC